MSREASAVICVNGPRVMPGRLTFCAKLPAPSTPQRTGLSVASDVSPVLGSFAAVDMGHLAAGTLTAHGAAVNAAGVVDRFARRIESGIAASFARALSANIGGRAESNFVRQ